MTEKFSFSTGENRMDREPLKAWFVIKGHIKKQKITLSYTIYVSTQYLAIFSSFCFTI